MEKDFLYLFRMFVLTCFVLVTPLSMVSCEPANSDKGDSDDDDTPIGSTPELTIPEGKKNCFTEGLSFGCSQGWDVIYFEINVDWTIQVTSDGDNVAWCSVERASGSEGAYQIVVRVTANSAQTPRAANIHLLSGDTEIAEIAVSQEDITKLYCPDDNHPHIIDLGISIDRKWACCNVGAKSPDDYGICYAWGEIEEKENYTLDNYTHYDHNTNHYINIGSDISGTEYDVAYMKWGKGWEMPTETDFWELLNKRTWYSAMLNGVKGHRFSGPSGHSIFFPIEGDEENYWSASSYTSSGEGDASWSLYLKEWNGEPLNGTTNGGRSGGLPVRPVVLD